jgi:hypothetical protein
LDLLKSELFYRLRSKINPEFKKKDFSYYVHQIKKIAPLSVEIQGEEFFLKILPSYFTEVVLNEENLIENILYLPLYFKKYQARHSIQDDSVELLDYEFTKYQIQTDPTPTKNSLYDLTSEVYMNPMAQAIRHEYDIHEFVKKYKKNPHKKIIPKKIKTLLLMSKNPDTSEVVFLKGTIHHAAIIDELHDGKIDRKVLLHTLQNRYSTIPQREWVIALGDLKNNFITLET